MLNEWANEIGSHLPEVQQVIIRAHEDPEWYAWF